MKKEKIKTKGFIQIPLLIAIIVSIIAVSTVTTGVVLYKQGKLTSLITSVSQIFKGAEESITTETEKSKPEPEQVSESQEEVIVPQPSDEDAQKRLAELEQRIKELEKQQQLKPRQEEITTPQNEQQDISETITASDLETVLPYVGQILCSTGYSSTEGSASLWIVDWEWGKQLVLTNAHVIAQEAKLCQVLLDKVGGYRLNITQIPSITFNDIVDFAFIKIQSISPGLEDVCPPISSLTSTLEYFPHCPIKTPLGSPVAIIGYPVGSYSEVEVEGTIGTLSPKTVTTGVISAYNENPTIHGYADVNYFVSAKIDKGNSGGLALSKQNGELCILGVPTWVQRGYFENMGIVQSIHNIWNPNP